jgi:predicted nucleic acid-binding protein
MHIFIDYGYAGVDLKANYFFDTNIWLSTNGPYINTTSRKAKIYSGFIKAVRSAGGQIFSDITVLSEFINRYARIEFDLASQNGSFQGQFKDFRKSDLWSPVAEDIRSEVSSIMLLSELVSDNGSTKASVGRICDDMISGESDFNDEIILDICRYNGFSLVTHDSDFVKVTDCAVVSGNATYKPPAVV